MSFSTVRDVVNEFGLVGETFEGSKVQFKLAMEVVYNQKQGSAYQRWVLSEEIEGVPVGKCYYGSRFDIIDALRDVMDLDPEDEVKQAKYHNCYVNKRWKEMKQRMMEQGRWKTQSKKENG